MNTLHIFKTAIVGAIIIGLLCAIFFCSVMQIENISPIARYVDIWIPALVMFFFMQKVKQERADGSFHFWEGLYMGNIIGIVGGMVSGLLLYLFISFISAKPLENYIAASLAYLEASKEFIDQNMKGDFEVKKSEIQQFTAWGLAKDESIRKIFYCFVLVPIISLLNRKK
jgi:Mn2+/Fe2+ NRAMP family transporter